MIRVRHLMLPPGLSAFVRRVSDGDLEVYVSDALEPERARAAVRMALRAVEPAGRRAGLLPLPLPLVLLLAGSRRWLSGLVRMLRGHALLTAAASTAVVAAAASAVVVFALPHHPPGASAGLTPSQLQQPPVSARGVPPVSGHSSRAAGGEPSRGDHLAPTVSPVAARSPVPATSKPGADGSAPTPQPSATGTTAPTGPTPSPTPSSSPPAGGGGGGTGGGGGGHCIGLVIITLCL